MREMTVADVKTCGCCPHAQVLLQARDGTTGVLLPLDAAVARYLRGGERAMGGEAFPLLMDRLLSNFAVKGYALKRVVVDLTAESVWVGRVCWGRHLLAEEFLCSPSEALLLAARARVPIWVTDAALHIRTPPREPHTLLTIQCHGQEVIPH